MIFVRSKKQESRIETDDRQNDEKRT